MVRPVEDLLDEPWLNACRYQTAALAERAFDRVERRRRAPSYVTRAEPGSTDLTRSFCPVQEE